MNRLCVGALRSLTSAAVRSGRAGRPAARRGPCQCSTGEAQNTRTPQAGMSHAHHRKTARHTRAAPRTPPAKILHAVNDKRSLYHLTEISLCVNTHRLKWCRSQSRSRIQSSRLPHPRYGHSCGFPIRCASSSPGSPPSHCTPHRPSKSSRPLVRRLLSRLRRRTLVPAAGRRR